MKILFISVQSRAQAATEFLLELNEDVDGDFIEEVFASFTTIAEFRTECFEQ